MLFTERIIINPEIRFGKPCIKNTRITVYDILSWLAAGMSNDDILNDFPELAKEDIQAALYFAADREKRISVA